ncbi:MAG: hypothetical protein IJX11_00120 [Bacteroidales bacterium]|nr:hypothetical protein [Bacteroidales bacterium]
MEQETGNKRKDILRRIGKVLAWTVVVLAISVAAVQAILSSPLPTRLINRYAAGYVDGDIRFGKLTASVLKHFPNISLTFEDLAVTYPHERFDSLEQGGVQGHLMYHGCGEVADTLASVRRFSASINVVALAAGRISLPYVELVKPRIFAHSYCDRSANWDMFRFPADTAASEDSSESPGRPPVILGKVSLTEHPHIVYTSSADTVFAMIDLKRMEFRGKFDTADLSRSRIGLEMDSMFVAGRISADTLALGLDMLHVHEHHRHMDFHAEAKTFLATRTFGRMKIPVGLRGSLEFPKDTVPALAVRNLTVDAADLRLNADARIRFTEEGKLPLMDIGLQIPEAGISPEGFGHEIRFGLDAGAATDGRGRLDVRIEDAFLNTTGLDFKASGGAKDILGADPGFELDGRLTAALDSLAAYIPDSLGYQASGQIEAELKGGIKLSQIDIYNFSKADLQGRILGDSILVCSVRDTLDMRIDGIDITLGPESRTSRRDSTKTRRLMAVTGEIAKADMSYKESLKLHADALTLYAMNSVTDDTTRINPLGGRIGAKELSLTDAAGASVKLDNTTNSFSIRPKRGQPKVPLLSFKSTNKRITLIARANRAILTDADIKASAAMNTVERKARRKEFLDSLSKVYPDIPYDSLFRHSMKQRASRPLPEWLSEEDFKKQDIDIRLDESLAKYFREWDLSGDIDIRTGIVMTPYFPLRNILRGFEAHFTNDEIGIDSLKFMSGKSELAVEGRLTGLKRALAGRGRNMAPLKLDVLFTSGGMDANELLTAYTTGSQFNPESMSGMEDVSNAEFLKMVTTDTTSVESPPSSLFVIPANIVANVKVDAQDIKYSDLNISRMKADLVMKERCVQITNTSATSNMGDIHFDGFYSTRTKEDLKTGFSLNFVDITAEKVISLMPAADTLLPMLKSFKGLLNCELAATAKLDTNMNILTPSINGVMRISGDDLSVSDNELFRTLAKKLLFKNRREGKIEHMTVEGLIKDNTLEIFPFVLKMDRYTLAMSGVQNLDMSFRYHVSVLKSPFIIRLGIDLSGPDFDNMKFRIGRAKYKSTKVPVFTSVIDTTRINLLSSIRNIFAKGVEAAIMENEKQEAIEEYKQETGYVKAVDQELEALSEEEQKQLEEEEQKEEIATSQAPRNDVPQADVRICEQ